MTADATKAQVHGTGEEVRGDFRCAHCDLLIRSPEEADGVLVLPICTLCGSESWRRS